ncbi:16S rRNA processing protein RimM [Sphingomonas koreensis]|uniref:Ribosome maturation factor RimM n=1 Tax=Sphingomonas koreensis TaxID=93064 RepID=A0A430G844_9SPHN|nr:ribosome maturation factor RimM [Sphingomonas koreensis]RSY89593.1 16S rRNA processing protein RimM [Sphingomonas koreensis]
MAKDSPVTLAVIIGAHGVTGEVRLKVFAQDLSVHRSFNGGALTLKSVRHGNNGAIARFAEIADRTAAEKMRGTELVVPRSALPPLEDGEYYHADLLGLAAVSESGEAIGTVVSVENFGAGDVIEIERTPVEGQGARRFMVPMRPVAVPRWDESTLTVADGWTE